MRSKKQLKNILILMALFFPVVIYSTKPAPSLKISPLKQTDYVAGVYQWEEIDIDYNGKDDLVLGLSGAPEGMILKKARISWTPSDLDEGQSYEVVLNATAGSLSESLQFVVNIATTKVITKEIEANELKFSDEDCNFSVPGFGAFKIIAKDSNTEEFVSLVSKKVTSEINYYLPAQVYRKSCFFRISPPESQGFYTGNYKINLPVYIDELPKGAPLSNVELYAFDPFEPTHSNQTGNMWQVYHGDAVTTGNGVNSYHIELDFPHKDTLYFIGITDKPNSITPEKN